ncbi:MAG: transposase [Ferrovum myxofaciens]|nr:MAG: transposase [Ferrovum myxofaciens]
MIIKYVRPIIKVKETETLSCVPAPQGVLDGSRADVSFLAGLIVNKFLYHQPLYRQHQRLLNSGITVSRPWLTQIKTGRTDAGTMKTGYFWPMYGDQDEICFLFYPDRSHKRVSQALRLDHPPSQRQGAANRWV